MPKKSDLEVTTTLVESNGMDAEQERLAAEHLRLARLATYTQRYSDGDNIRQPIEDLEYMRNVIGVHGVLQTCNVMKATVIAGLGYNIAESPYTAEDIDPKEKPLFEEWVRETFEPSLPTVAKNMRVDYEHFGQGLLLIDENANSIIRNGKKVGREISKVRHLNKQDAHILLPRKKSITCDDEQHVIDDPEDVKFPRWRIGTGTAKTYAKTYGDPRFIHKYTGDTQSESWGRETPTTLRDGPSVMALTEYDSRDPVCGFPLWFSEKKSCDVLWEINRYEWGHFRKNCMPNLVAILPKTTARAGNKDMPGQFQDLLTETHDQRAAGADTRKCIVIEYTEQFTRNPGQMQFLIQEIKGPDPSQFLEMEKRKNQLVAISTMFPASLIHADTGSLGSGKDKEAEVKRFKEFVVDPEQRRINVEMFDVLIRKGTNFKTVVIRLNSIDVSDLNAEVDRWTKIDGLKSLQLSDKREKMGITHPLSDDATENERLGKVFLFGAQDQAVTPDVLSKQLDSAIERLDAMDQETPVEDQPIDNLDEQRLVSAIASVMMGNPTPDSVRTVMVGLKEKVLPAVRNVIER